MKKFKKLLVGAIALMMAFSTVACGGGGGAGDTSSSTPSGGNTESSTPSGGGSESSAPGSDGEYVPQKPYTLSVYSFSGGYGVDWLNALMERYKKERAGDEIVVDGITYDGIDFAPTTAKSILEGMVGAGEQYDVWFQEQVFYNQYVEMGNLFKDMTDVMTDENPYEPGKTLESKLTEEQKIYYERDGKYYGIPHYAGYVGIVYNKQLFDANRWYLAKDYDQNDLVNDPAWCFVQSLLEERTPGPDGMPDTDDDGLPTTYEEFYALCNVISSSNKPISWSGKHRHGYLGWFLTALSANNEGLDQMALNYSFEGTATDLITVTEDSEGNITETPLDDLVLNEDTAKTDGYKLAAQRGKYYELDFLETIVDNGWYTESSFSATDEQTDAQRSFVEGTVDFTQRGAMLIDGCWWEMESKSSFEALSQAGVTNPKDNFGWFPLPCVDQAAADARAAALSDDDPTTKGYTLTDTHNSLCFIGNQVSKDVYALAKDFIQFAYTDESLAEFSIITDTTKAVQYTMTPAQKAQMSAYGRSLMNMQENANIVYAFSKNEFYQNNESRFVDYESTFNAQIGGRTVEVAVDEFRRGVTASAYFKGLYDEQQYVWNTYIVK